MKNLFRETVINIIGLLLLLTALSPAGDLVINEIMASNSMTIADEDGDYPDWLELYNDSAEPIDLSGYGLSDDVAEPFKWTFSDARIHAGQHLLIFASDKDRRMQNSVWETIIDQGDLWKYQVGSANIPSNWNELDFQDDGWSSGASGFGYADGDDATILENGTVSVYIRKKFTIANMDKVLQVVLHVDYDDGFVAYLNGVEIARANMSGYPPAFDDFANNAREAEMYNGGVPVMYTSDAYRSLLQEGDNVLAIQGHNVNTSSSDMSLIPFLTLGLTEIPEDPRGTPDFFQSDEPLLHTNFKISAAGETLVLKDPSGTIIDQCSVPEISTDISWGRYPDASENWNMMQNPTPGETNDGSGIVERAEAPQFSQTGGFYDGSIELTLTNESAAGTVYYTLDGSEPTTSSSVYQNSISIDKTMVVRAKVIEQNKLPSQTVTQTYFIRTNHTLPVFSLSTDPYNFFDIDYGIYVLGPPDYNFDDPQYGANFWEDWERPIHVEFFEPDGTYGFGMDAGVKIIGGWSRANAQKNFAIFARSKYGYSSVKYRLFPDRPFDEYEAFLLRGGGNDWQYTHFSDGLAHQLVDGINMDNTAFRPCVVYVNGEYWGILNLREKQNEHYLAMYHDIDPDNIDMLEWNQSAIHGDAQHYSRLVNFIETNDLQDPENYEYVATQIDIDNFIDYMVTEIYIDNRDWPGNNIKYWRPKTTNGKWRWMMYDTDFGFGIYDGYSADYNTLQLALDPNGPDWPNPPWSTFLLRSLVENDEFRAQFINRFADYFNTIFKPTAAVDKINIIQNLIQSEMPAHVEKWSREYPDWAMNSMWWDNIEHWNGNVAGLRRFVNARIDCLSQDICSQFGLSGMASLKLQIAPEGSGNIQISSLFIDDSEWIGRYFKGVPIAVRAIPYDNFRFSHWEALKSTSDNPISVTLNSGGTLRAVFESNLANKPGVVINEINYHSNPEHDTQDWVELYNNGADVNLAWWLFKDTNDIFYLNANQVLKHGNYLVVCEDTAAFKSFYPDVDNVIGNFQFRLNNDGEVIQLCSNLGTVIDSLIYSNRYPWSIMPDGGGATLELKNPNMDNTLAYAWSASDGYGSPGRVNGNFTTGVLDSGEKIAASFQLYPNFPNPFNATTTIQYEISEPSLVTVSIYNLRGQLVKIIQSEWLQPGYQQLNWDAGQLSSGLYFFRVSAGEQIATRKCLLIK